MDSLREKMIAELSYGLSCFDVQITGTAEKFIIDRILALPEMEALRLKPIKTMPVRENG